MAPLLSACAWDLQFQEGQSARRTVALVDTISVNSIADKNCGPSQHALEIVTPQRVLVLICASRDVQQTWLK